MFSKVVLYEFKKSTSRRVEPNEEPNKEPNKEPSPAFAVAFALVASSGLNCSKQVVLASFARLCPGHSNGAR